MPLPWKKLRISQLVADLQSPAKRRGSMVVETGFPTSLVDLFVKNRDRLRKTSKKHSHKSKHGHRRGIDSSDVPSTNSPPNEVPVRTPPQTIPPSSSTVGTAGLRRPNMGRFSVVEAVEVAGGCYCNDIGNIEPIRCVDGNKSFANRVFAAVLKMFVVVALALSTKKLVVGITLSAFALLLLECLGKHIDVDLGVFLKPCSDASKNMLDSIHRGMSLFRLERKLEKCNPPRRLVSQESPMLCDPLDEIESVGDSNCEEEIRGREEGAGLGCFIADRESNCVEMRRAVEGSEDRGEEALLYGKNQSRSRRIKAKIIKKCVPKKLRDLRKKKSKGSELEEDGNEKSSIEEQEDCAEAKTGGKSKDESQMGRGREGSSGYQMLILIVLVGLVGGRIWAFALTFLWCLALKSLGNPRTLQISIRRWDRILGGLG